MNRCTTYRRYRAEKNDGGEKEREEGVCVRERRPRIFVSLIPYLAGHMSPKVPFLFPLILASLNLAPVPYHLPNVVDVLAVEVQTAGCLATVCTTGVGTGMPDYVKGVNPGGGGRARCLNVS